MHVADLLDLALLDEHLAAGFVKHAFDAASGLTLFNYSDLCQFSGTWDDVTMNCRGLVVDADGYIVSRPLRKFFNVEQHASPHLEPLPTDLAFDVFPKEDGSCLIVGKTAAGVQVVTTRGSFDSSQAVAGRRMLAGEEFPDGKTVIFEYVAPSNRIVLPYPEEKLILLAVVDNETGADDDEAFAALAARFDHVKPLPYRTWAELVAARDAEGIEGFVVRYSNGLRVKLKTEWYCALHRTISGVSTKSIWEAWKGGADGFRAFLAGVPDELHPWITEVSDGLWARFQARYDEVRGDFDAIFCGQSRKEFALAARSSSNWPYMFMLYDERPIGEKLWDEVRPAFAQPSDQAA